MKERVAIARLLIFLIVCPWVASRIQGCGVIIPGTPWSKTNYIGPQLIGNSRAAVVHRCAAIEQFMSRGPCELAFIDHNEAKIHWDDLRSDIDKYLPKIALLAPYIPKERYELGKYPYNLHILTISPIIVLAVPISNSLKDNRYHGTSYGSGSMESAITGVTYSYMGNPLISDGTFWFSPTLNIGTTFLPDNVKSYSIDLGNSRIEMTAKGNKWEIQRNIKNSR